MSKKILVLTGSPRKDGNSDLLAKAFSVGAKASGHEVEIFNAGISKIQGCVACDSCFLKGTACSFNDDFSKLAPLMLWADSIVIVSPMYWFTFTAQIKAALDKMYSFIIGEKPLHIKESFLISCAETEDESEFDGIIASYKRIAKYQKWKDRGHFVVAKVSSKGDVKNTDALEKVQKIGRDF